MNDAELRAAEAAEARRLEENRRKALVRARAKRINRRRRAAAKQEYSRDLATSREGETQFTGIVTTGALWRTILVPVIIAFWGLIAVLFGGHNGDWRWMWLLVEISLFWVVLVIIDRFLLPALVLILNTLVILVMIVVVVGTFLTLFSYA